LENKGKTTIVGVKINADGRYCGGDSCCKSFCNLTKPSCTLFNRYLGKYRGKFIRCAECLAGEINGK